jgi:hypothetical protein
LPDSCAAYAALKHSFESMNPELNPSFVHRMSACQKAVAASVATIALYAAYRMLSHAIATLH